MKTLFKILVIAISFSGIAMAQTVNAGYSGTTSPCTYTLCRPFNQTDMQQIWQAIMFNGANSNVNTAESYKRTKVSFTVDGTVNNNEPLGGTVFTFTDVASNGRYFAELKDITVTTYTSPCFRDFYIDFFSAPVTGTVTTGQAVNYSQSDVSNLVASTLLSMANNSQYIVQNNKQVYTVKSYNPVLSLYNGTRLYAVFRFVGSSCHYVGTTFNVSLGLQYK